MHSVKTLFLVRHAKSSWDDPALPDKDRPLNDRGKRDAPKMGERLAKRDAKPDLILSSPARRALKTAEIFAEELDYKRKAIVVDDRLYAATSDDLLDVIRKLGEKVERAMMFGHNPELTELAHRFSSEITHMPTCAVAEFTFDTKSWSKLGKDKPAKVAFELSKAIVRAMHRGGGISVTARFACCFASWIAGAISCSVAFAQPLVSLSRAGIEWGIVNAWSLNDTQPVFVSNTGNAPLTLRRLAVAADAGAPFLTSGTCQPGTVLPAGGRCRIDIALFPASPIDPAEALLTIETDGAPGRVDVALHATSVAISHAEYRAPNFTPDWIEFAPQAVGFPAANGSTTLRNDGALPWRVRKLQLVGDDSTDFTLATDCVGLTLRRGDLCTVSVGFLPTAAGPRSTQLLLEFDESAITFRSITGVGAATVEQP